MIPIGLLSEASETVLDASELVSAVETDSEETVCWNGCPHCCTQRETAAERLLKQRKGTHGTSFS